MPRGKGIRDVGLPAYLYDELQAEATARGMHVTDLVREYVRAGQRMGPTITQLAADLHQLQEDVQQIRADLERRYLIPRR